MDCQESPYAYSDFFQWSNFSSAWIYVIKFFFNSVIQKFYLVVIEFGCFLWHRLSV